MSTPALGSRAFKADPFPFYKKLRESAPVHRVWLSRSTDAYLIARYADCQNALRDHERIIKDVTVASGKRPAWMPGFLRPLSRNMLDLDDPDHARLRRLVHKAFTPRLVETLEPRILEIVDRLLTDAESRGGMDLIRDFALPLPVTIISEMLGVPEEDRHRFQRWSNRMVSADTSALHALMAVPSAYAFMQYVRKMIRDRRREPREDLVTSLVAADDEGDRLSEDEMVAMIVLLLVAGHETTVNLIGNGVLTLLAHAEQKEALIRDLWLIDGAIEEILRYDGPVLMASERYALEEVEIQNVRIPRGSMVYVVLASANRDEQQFADADEFDIRRTPNRHLAFGQGVHFCLGSPLARMEGTRALSRLLERFPGVRLAIPRDRLRWRRGMLLRGVESMPVLLK
ncbi:MAG: cytochrome P450 [Phycisphaeraceae bacterium]|nr:cytochrome P450 [Phycisphaeraceae bacterium]